MERVVAFVGSARKKHTYDAAVQFGRNLSSLGDIEYEVIPLSDYRIEPCRGCRACFLRGEDDCPLQDDRDLLIDKMLAADGVVMASPNYSFQVSAITKAFLDRLGFVFHRPRFFGRAYTSIVTEGIYGGRKIVSYLDFVGRGLGFNTVKGSSLMTLDPMTDKQQRTIDRVLAAQAARFKATLEATSNPVPSLFWLMAFRMGRTRMKILLDESNIDYRYYAEKGWFDSDYYYPTDLGLLKTGAGRLLDSLAVSMARRR